MSLLDGANTVGPDPVGIKIGLSEDEQGSHLVDTISFSCDYFVLF